MSQEQLDGLVAFIAVAQSGSFSAAAVKLGVTPSAMSQQILTLERRLDIRLFNRTTRGVSLTESGQRYYERILPAVGEITAANEELGDESAAPRGVLRLNLSRAAYMIVIQPILRRFLDAHPGVNLELRVENQLVDIVRQGFDAGIRFGDHVEKDMIAVGVGPPLSVHVLASPEYLRHHGEPKHPDDLAMHQCIAFRYISSGQVERWLLEKDGERHEVMPGNRLTVNDSGALVQAALDGLGLVYMINGYVEPLLKQGSLRRVLADWSPSEPGFTLYYSNRHIPAKLRALVDMLKAEDAAEPRVDGWLRVPAG